jgi:hypothetical protein
MYRSTTSTTSTTSPAGVTVALALLLGAGVSGGLRAQQSEAGGGDPAPIVLQRQGSFAVDGRVVTLANGMTLHGDHAYVEFQVPPDRRRYPLVMWHGGGQFSKTWESTPDGREGYQTIFLRRDYSVYNRGLPQARESRLPVIPGPLRDAGRLAGHPGLDQAIRE